ncbi:MAG: alpha/beta fold hydrolase [Gammaproteobacteria bacterium]
MHNTLGQNWLLLRGLSREAAHWGEFVPLLQNAFPAARISTLDLPGTGCLYRHASPKDIAGIAENLRRQAIRNGLLHPPVIVLALSLGAMVAWEWLLKHPEDIGGAILINTSFAGLSPFYRRLRWQSYGKFLRVLLQSNVYKRELAILRLVCNRLESDESIARYWSNIYTERPISVQNSLRQIIAAAAFRPPDTVPQRPVLLLNAQNDRLVSAECSTAIQQKWQLPLRSHPWGGHDLPLDDGAWVIKQMQTWIAETALRN